MPYITIPGRSFLGDIIDLYHSTSSVTNHNRLTIIDLERSSLNTNVDLMIKYKSHSGRNVVASIYSTGNAWRWEMIHYKKSCLPRRTWSSTVVDGDHPARIFGPPWPIRKLFFRFRGPLQPRIGPKRAHGRPACGRCWFQAFGCEVNANLCFDEHGAQMSASLAIFFFSWCRTCLSFPDRGVCDSRWWVPDVSLTERENFDFLDSFSPLISGYSALTSIPAPC